MPIPSEMDEAWPGHALIKNFVLNPTLQKFSQAGQLGYVFTRNYAADQVRLRSSMNLIEMPLAGWLRQELLDAFVKGAVKNEIGVWPKHIPREPPVQ